MKRQPHFIVETTSIDIRRLNFHFQLNANAETTFMNIDSQRCLHVDSDLMCLLEINQLGFEFFTKFFQALSFFLKFKYLFFWLFFLEVPISKNVEIGKLEMAKIGKLITKRTFFTVDKLKT